MPRGGDRASAGRVSHSRHIGPRRLLRPYRISARIDAQARAGLVSYWRSRRLQDPRVTLSDCINELFSAAGGPKFSTVRSRF